MTKDKMGEIQMEVVSIREKKWVLWIGLIGALVLTGAAAFCIWNGSMQMLLAKYERTIVYLAAIDVGCIFMVAFYCRRKVVIYPGYLAYTPLIGRKRTIAFREITEIIAVKERYFVIDTKGKRVAAYERNMSGCDAAHQYLCARGIPVANCDYPVMPRADEEFALPKKQWNSQMPRTWKDYILLPKKERIAQQKKITKGIRISIAVVCIALYLLQIVIGFEQRVILSVYVAVLLFYFGLYVGFYPNMIWNKASKCDEYHMAFPYIQCALIMIYLARFLDTIKFMTFMWIVPAVVIAVVLWAVYLGVAKSRNVKDHILKRIGVMAIVLFFTFLSTGAMLYVAAGQETELITTELLDKEMHKSSRSINCYFTIEWNGTQRVQVDKQLYEAVEIGEAVNIGIGESVFGIRYWKIQE